MKRRSFLLTLLAPLAALALAGCPAASGGAGAGGARANLAGRKIRVTTTVGMVADIVRNVGGDRVEVTALMGPGIDPHYYKATSGDVSALNRADIIFYNGLELEGKMGEIFERIAKNKPTVAVSSTVDRANLRQPREFQGRYDPHIWFDVTLWQQASRAVETRSPNRTPAAQTPTGKMPRRTAKRWANCTSTSKNRSPRCPRPPAC